MANFCVITPIGASVAMIEWTGACPGARLRVIILMAGLEPPIDDPSSGHGPSANTNLILSPRSGGERSMQALFGL